MSKMMLSFVMLTLLSGVTTSVLVNAEESDGKKYSTKEVMKVAFKGGLLKKVSSGNASAEEAKNLHAMLVSLSKNQPKKGDADSWKKLTSALVKASTAVKEGTEGAGAMLQKASNCKACHNIHK
ncbi:MAG: hypothetical protein VX694_06880 [Planctomycetota bacterium]|nr:hypothetical protein [Planctomycetota bacterium]